MAPASGCSLACSRLAARRRVSSRSVVRDSQQLRLAFGERAGFVDDQRVDFFHGLEGFGVLDQDSGVGAAAGADHDGHGSGESEGAGAGDDQNRDSVDQRVRETRLRTECEPRDEGDGGERHDCGYEPGGDAIGEALDGGAAALGLADQSGRCGRAGFRSRRARRA